MDLKLLYLTVIILFHFQVLKDGLSIRSKFPEGGCTAPCTARLECGHTCRLSCHSWDPRHETTTCREPCQRGVRPDCPLGHVCRLRCFKDCGPCPDKVNKVIEKCGHQLEMKCSDDPKKAFCMEKCSKTRSCGHECKL